MNDFFANRVEMFGAIGGNFYNDMYQEGFYLPLGIIMLSSAAGIAAVYYYALNHPRCNRWFHWLFFGLGVSLLNFIIDWVLAQDKLIAYYNAAQQNMPYEWDSFLILALMGFVWSFVFFFVFSFCMKWGSRNCKHTPFL